MAMTGLLIVIGDMTTRGISASGAEPRILVEFAGGTGAPDDPYQIATREQLVHVGQDPNLSDKHLMLVADIDLDPNLSGGQVFLGAVISEFHGSFAGNGFVLQNLTIKGQSLLGLFGTLHRGAVIQNLGLVDASIRGSGDSIGTLAGYNDGTVSNCYSTGFVNGDTQVGGLIGENPRGSIVDCYSMTVVQGEKSIGGLTGLNQSQSGGRGRGAPTPLPTLPRGGIADCTSRGSVSGLYEVGGLIGMNHGPVSTSYSDCTVNGYDNVGGLIGCNHASVDNCYSMGSAEGDDYVGGLIGDNQGSIETCYSVTVVSGEDYVGGLAGSTGITAVRNSCWDMERSSLEQSAGGVGLTTAQMMDPYWYGLNSWAHDSHWILNPGEDYPHLAWEGTPGQPMPEPIIDWLDGSGQADDPYQITSADQLILVSQASLLWDRHFILTRDIDLDPNIPGGRIFAHAVIPEFSGSFKGNGFMINNLITTGDHYLGFFGSLHSDAHISQLGIVNAQVAGTGDDIGCLVGYNRGSIHRCFSSGTVAGHSVVGGFVGTNAGTVANCYSSVVVKADKDPGAFVGRNHERIENCYSNGSVLGERVWWFVGDNHHHSSRAEIVNCFWELPSSPTSYTGAATSLSTTEMQTRNTFTRAGWDFNDIWAVCEASSYPHLQWEEIQCSE